MLQAVPQPVIHQIVVLPPTQPDTILIAQALLMLCSALIALWLAWTSTKTVRASWKTADETAKTAEANSRNTKLAIFAQLMDGYASTAMLEAMSALQKWKRDQPDNAKRNQDFIASLKNGEESATKLNGYRRLIVHYMNKVRFFVDDAELDLLPIGFRRLLSEGTISVQNPMLESMQKELDLYEKRPPTTAPKTIFKWWRDTFPSPHQAVAANV